MSAFAPPVRRGEFFYSSVLYADPGNDNPHARASVAELAALLRPEAPRLYANGRKPESSAPAKDPPWHYYSSQLIHYGLPITKDKNTAKVRLLNAMNQFKLEVPAWVLNMENELKKEWEAENKKMKKSAAGSAADKLGGKAKPKAKAVQGADKGVNVTASGMSMAGHLGTQQYNTSPANTPSPSKRKRVDDSMSAKSKGKKESTPTKRVKKEPTPARVKQENHRSSPSNTAPRSRVKHEYGLPMVQPSPYRAIGPYENSGSSQNGILLSGLYEVDCPIASDTFIEYDFNLTLSLDPSRGIWWATFRWGAWDGIIQMNPGPSFGTLGQPCTLGWRLRDLDSNQLKFGKKCTGQMMFFDDQTFVGSLYEIPGVGTLGFEGRRLPGSNIEDDLQDEWDAFVTEAYRR